jgi:hypothetical protein
MKPYALMLILAIACCGAATAVCGPIQNSFTVSDPFTSGPYGVTIYGNSDSITPDMLPGVGTYTTESEIDERDELRDLLERCLEFVPDDPSGVEYVDEESMKRKQLRRDIESAIGRME